MVGMKARPASKHRGDQITHGSHNGLKQSPEGYLDPEAWSLSLS